MINIKINLATRKYFRKGYGVVMPLVIILMTAVLFIYLHEKVGREKASAERLEKRILELSKNRPISTTSKEMLSSEDVEAAREILNKREFSWIAALDNVENAMPAGISLSTIEPTFKEGGVKLSGMARDFSVLSRFIVNLEKLKVYKRVYLVNQTAKEVDNERTAISFNINVEGRR